MAKSNTSDGRSEDSPDRYGAFNFAHLPEVEPHAILAHLCNPRIAHLHDFINAYNYGRRLKTLRGLTPYEYICKCWANEPNRFTSNPHHQRPGPST